VQPKRARLPILGARREHCVEVDHLSRRRHIVRSRPGRPATRRRSRRSMRVQAWLRRSGVAADSFESIQVQGLSRARGIGRPNQESCNERWIYSSARSLERAQKAFHDSPSFFRLVGALSLASSRTSRTAHPSRVERIRRTRAVGTAQK
jgi:hypothetical protein